MATRWLPLALVLVIAALLLVPATVRADDGPDGEARVAGRCTGGAASELRVRTRDDGELRIDLVLWSGGPAQRWLVVVVHERRIVYRGAVRAGRELEPHRAPARGCRPVRPGHREHPRVQRPGRDVPRDRDGRRRVASAMRTAGAARRRSPRRRPVVRRRRARAGSAPRSSRSRTSCSSPDWAALWSAVKPPSSEPFGSAPASSRSRASATERTNAAVPSGATRAIALVATASTSAPCWTRSRVAPSRSPKTARWSAVKPSSENALAREGSSRRSPSSRASRPNAAASNTDNSPSGAGAGGRSLGHRRREPPSPRPPDNHALTP